MSEDIHVGLLSEVCQRISSVYPDLAEKLHALDLEPMVSPPPGFPLALLYPNIMDGTIIVSKKMVQYMTNTQLARHHMSPEHANIYFMLGRMTLSSVSYMEFRTDSSEPFEQSSLGKRVAFHHGLSIVLGRSKESGFEPICFYRLALNFYVGAYLFLRILRDGLPRSRRLYKKCLRVCTASNLQCGLEIVRKIECLVSRDTLEMAFFYGDSASFEQKLSRHVDTELLFGSMSGHPEWAESDRRSVFTLLGITLPAKIVIGR